MVFAPRRSTTAITSWSTAPDVHRQRDKMPTSSSLPRSRTTRPSPRPPCSSWSVAGRVRAGRNLDKLGLRQDTSELVFSDVLVPSRFGESTPGSHLMRNRPGRMQIAVGSLGRTRACGPSTTSASAPPSVSRSGPAEHPASPRRRRHRGVGDQGVRRPLRGQKLNAVPADQPTPPKAKLWATEMEVPLPGQLPATLRRVWLACAISDRPVGHRCPRHPRVRRHLGDHARDHRRDCGWSQPGRRWLTVSAAGSPAFAARPSATSRADRHGAGPDKTAIIDGEVNLTFASLDDRVIEVVAALWDNGFRKGGPHRPAVTQLLAVRHAGVRATARAGRCVPTTSCWVLMISAGILDHSGVTRLIVEDTLAAVASRRWLHDGHVDTGRWSSRPHKSVPSPVDGTTSPAGSEPVRGPVPTRRSTTTTSFGSCTPAAPNRGPKASCTPVAACSGTTSAPQSAGAMSEDDVEILDAAVPPRSWTTSRSPTSIIRRDQHHLPPRSRHHPAPSEHCQVTNSLRRRPSGSPCCAHRFFDEVDLNQPAQGSYYGASAMPRQILQEMSEAARGLAVNFYGQTEDRAASLTAWAPPNSGSMPGSGPPGAQRQRPPSRR